MTQKKKIEIESPETSPETNAETEQVVSEAEKVTAGEKKAAKSETDPLDQLQNKLEAAEQEAKETYDRFLRVSADFENFKKRSARELEELRKYANQSLLKELLVVVDNLERALSTSQAETPADDHILAGVDLTLKELLKIFEKFNVKPIESLHKPFDPNFHQAVMREPDSEQPQNTVIKELQKGYLLHNRLLRPAMVVVSAAENNTIDK